MSTDEKADVPRRYRVAVTVEVVVTSRRFDVIATAETQVANALDDYAGADVVGARLLGPVTTS